jgi:hypothetical protein
LAIRLRLRSQTGPTYWRAKILRIFINESSNENNKNRCERSQFKIFKFNIFHKIFLDCYMNPLCSFVSHTKQRVCRVKSFEVRVAHRIFYVVYIKSEPHGASFGRANKSLTSVINFDQINYQSCNFVQFFQILNKTETGNLIQKIILFYINNYKASINDQLV